MRLSLITWPLLVSTATAACMSRNCGRPGYGFIGFGIDMYLPVCTYTCQDCFKSTPLTCSDAESAPIVSQGNFSKSPSDTCHASSIPFLTSVAWCVKQKCGDYPTWKLERWWASYAVGNLESDPAPILSYGESLALITTPPTVVNNKSLLLNETKLVDNSLYTAIYIAIDVNQDVEIQHEQFALVIFLSGVGFPILFSFISRFVPFPKRLSSALDGRFNYPLSFRPWRTSSVATVVGEPPTRGQAIFVAYFILLNIFLSAFGFETHPGEYGYWWNNGPDEIMGNLANRFGVLAFANFALLVLFSSRNNVLLWLTNWKYSTYVLLHRWVGRIAILETILHSLVDLRDWIVQGRLAAAQITPFWYWGCVGTIAASLLLPFSIPVLRQRLFEPFLLVHIIGAILVFVGSWYHIIYEYQHQWGYETWLYMVFAIWGFDWLVRILRIARNGLRTATITPIDDDYVRVTIPGTVAQGHVYLYFLQWRFWRNHPFTVASTVIHLDSDRQSVHTKAIEDDITPTEEPSHDIVSLNKNVETGMVFYLRLLGRDTQSLRRRTQVKVLIEGSYGFNEDLSEYPTLICIAGGIGITACLPYVRAHPGYTHLFWGSRSQTLVDSVKSQNPGLDIESVVGERLDLKSILEGQHGDFAVVVCGPPGMMDEAREIVSRLSRRKRIKFVAEAFTY